MAFDWRKLAKDKRVWIGAAGVAGLAAFMSMRARSSGGGGGAAPVGSGANPVGGYVGGSADTTGTDMASFLGNAFQAQNQAQAAGFQSVIDAIKGGGTGQNEDPPPAVVWTKDPQGKPMWALLNSPYGGWMTTDQQGQANQWAANYGGSGQTADFVDWTSWNKLKEKWGK